MKNNKIRETIERVGASTHPTLAAPALLLGYLKLLATKELLDEMTPDEIRAAAAQFTQKTKLCR